MKITSQPILLVADDQVDVMRSIDAYWTISEVPL
jgi:hypothetical protein